MGGELAEGGSKGDSDVEGSEAGEAEQSKDGRGGHAMDIPGLAAARVHLAGRAGPHLDDLRVQATTVRGKRELVRRHLRAKGKGVMAPALKRETLARGLGFRDEDRLPGGRCHACRKGMECPPWATR